MFKGFYNLTSGMLCQNRNLDVVSNNIANMSTPGFKKDKFMSTSFQETLLSRTGNKDKANSVALGSTTSAMRVADETVTRYSQGGFEETGSTLDFALSQNGFFQIQREDGNLLYTRNGSFIIDEQGYLSLARQGRVMGENGPILLNTDNVHMGRDGTLYNGENQPMGRIAVVDFVDYQQLTKVDEGLFQSAAPGNIVQNSGIVQKNLEKSNVEPIEEMTAMMKSQRALQSASQVLKMYDQIMAKASSEVGRL